AKGYPKVVPNHINAAVDFMSGPSTVATPGDLVQGNTGLVTKKHSPVSRSQRRSMYSGRNSRSLRPVMSRAAIFARGMPVAFDTKGTVRDARGFTSSTYTLSL